MNSDETRTPSDESEGLGLVDYLAILRRRIWYLVLPTIVIFAVTAAVALTVPATYRSTATILIEQQQIPQDLVRSTVTSYADQRVQNISQRVMTTANLSEIIKKYDLFSEERKKESLQSLVQQMRQDIKLEMIDAKVVDPRSGSAKKATIAFTLSFESPSARKAQQVANELVSLFLDENLRKRQEAARETSEFLGGEADRLAERITDLEVKVARFKEANGENLPDMQQVNAQFLDRTEDQLERNALETRLLDERIAFLEAELRRTPRYGQSDSEGNSGVKTPKDRLMELELAYVQLAARAKENHPDRILLERQILALRQQTGGLDAERLEEMLQRARTALEGRRKELADSHPDVKSAARAVASLEKQLARVRASNDGATASQLPENPAFVRVKTQIDSARAERDYLRQQKAKLAADLVEYEVRVKEAPKVEREYRALTRDYDNAIAKYREITAKEMEAELAESLESERKAERFVLIEPPLVPGKPIKPNRIAIIFMGAVLSLGGGLGTTVLREMVSPHMYGAKAVAAVTGAVPIGVVPLIQTAREAARKRRRKWYLAMGLLLLLAAALVAVHLYVKPLDVAAYRVMQRLDLV